MCDETQAYEMLLKLWRYLRIRYPNSNRTWLHGIALACAKEVSTLPFERLRALSAVASVYAADAPKSKFNQSWRRAALNHLPCERAVSVISSTDAPPTQPTQIHDDEDLQGRCASDYAFPNH
jgi:hypothetical protein